MKRREFLFLSCLTAIDIKANFSCEFTRFRLNSKSNLNLNSLEKSAKFCAGYLILRRFGKKSNLYKNSPEFTLHR